MKINILLPYKEKFDKEKPSSVSISIINNLLNSRFYNDINIFGQKVKNPFLKNNFFGIKYSFFSLKSKNYFLASEMLKIIKKSKDKEQLIEIHNRPYLVNYLYEKNKNNPISLFIHTEPQQMKGLKTLEERKKILEKCAGVFCVSRYIQKQFLEGITYNRDKVLLLYNGVNQIVQKLPIKNKEIIFVGRLVHEKGVDIFVDAVKEVAPLYPDWKFILIGASNNKMKNRNFYENNIIKKFLSIGTQAEFHKSKDNDFVKNVMKSASIIVVPSRNEAFGLVIAEALSSGLVVIASDKGAIPEILQDDGIILEGINHSKVKDSLINLIENANERKKIQKIAISNFRYSSIFSSKKLDEYRDFIFKSFF